MWNPYLKQDIQTVKRVQRRFTKKMAGFYDKTNEERLSVLDALTLENARREADLTAASVHTWQN
jgi:hypothetical protein